MNFTEILKNIGDFGRSAEWQPEAGVVITNPGRESARGEIMRADWDGSHNAYNDQDTRGYRVVRPVTEAQRRRMYEGELMRATKLIKAAFDGNGYARLMLRDAMHGNLREALSISDFPNLFGDVIDRAVLANYMETPYTWNQVAKLSTVSDFREVKRFRVDNGTGFNIDTTGNVTGTAGSIIPIPMGGEYPEDKLTDNFYQYRVQKYGKRMPFFWETFVNDDLNAIKDTPARFGRAMRRMEEYFVTKLYANNTSFYTTGNKNIVAPTGIYATNNPALSITALAQALTILSQQKDLDGQPISIEAVTLVVPPALKVTAQNILNADYFWANDQGGTISGNTSAQRLNVRNWAKNIVQLAVNYYLPIVDTSFGNTGWYIFADPNSGRPALEFGKLRGHESPDLFMKLPNAVAIGEGTMGPGMGVIPGTTNMNPMEGDFDTDSVHYKIRHVFGGTQIDPLMSVYSNGGNV